MRRGLVPAVLLLLGLPAALVAQGGAASAALLRFRDSLAAITDSVALREFERERIEVARQRRDSTLLHLELGLVAARLGEVADRDHFDDALGEFAWAAELEPRWPWPWYATGMTEERIGDSKFSPLAGFKAMLGEDAMTRAADAMVEALDRDPGFAPALDALSRLALAQRVNLRLDAALAAHRRAAGTEAARMPAILLARGRVERLVGSPDSALVAFRAYRAAGGLEPLALLEEARTLFVLDSLSGQAPYYAGARFDDTMVVGMYRADIAPITSDADLVAFDAQAGTARATWLHTFWRARGEYDLRGEGERLQQHYLRLHQARKRYRIAAARRRYDLDERYRSGSRDFDDRGIILIRHGEPDDSATFVYRDACANITWRYDRPEGNLLFHFVARSDVSDFHLVESLMDIAEAGGMYNFVHLECQAPPRSDLALSREHLDPEYLRLATASTNSYTMLQQRERQRGQRDLAIGTTTDRYPLRFADSLDVRAEGVALGFGEDGRPLLQVAIALRGATARAVETPDGATYPVRVRLMARNSAGQVVAFVDTLRTYAPRERVTDDGFLVGRLAVPVDTGLVEWRLAVDQGGSRGFVFPRQRTVAAAGSGGLALSDIALGAPRLSAEWEGGLGERIRLNPLGAWRSGSDLDLYAEVYGTSSGAPLAVELTLSRLGGGKFLGILGGKKRSLTVTSTEPARGATSPIRKTVTLTDLAPGEYRLRVRVRDGEGRAAERERTILVRPRAPGAGG